MGTWRHFAAIAVRQPLCPSLEVDGCGAGERFLHHSCGLWVSRRLVEEVGEGAALKQAEFRAGSRREGFQEQFGAAKRWMHDGHERPPQDVKKMLRMEEMDS